LSDCKKSAPLTQWGEHPIPTLDVKVYPLSLVRRDKVGFGELRDAVRTRSRDGYATTPK